MKHYLLNNANKYRYIILIFDTLVIAGSVFISYLLREFLNSGNLSFDFVVHKLNITHLIIILLHMLTLYVFDLYNFSRIINPIKFSLKIILSVVFAGVLISGLFFFFPKYVFGRQVLIIHIGVLSFFLVSWRIVFLKINRLTFKLKRLAIVGSCKIVMEFIQEIRKLTISGFEISHVWLTEENDGCTLPLYDIKIYSSLTDLLRNNQFDVLGFDLSNGNFSNDQIKLIIETRQKGMEIHDLPNLYKNITGKIPLEYIDGRWLLNNENMQGIISRFYIHLKRLFDVVLSIMFIVLFLPFFILTAILVKIESKGGIIFSQERLGQNRKPFMCYKFRTMVEKAEHMSGPVWASKNDRRITKLGRVLRKSRLDELPQLWNILRGDISFVGPRPIRKCFADQLAKESPFYELRFSIKPGLSGWAQVHGCYAVPYGKETLQYELFYIQNMSLLLDLLTVFKTAQSFFKVEGK